MSSERFDLMTDTELKDYAKWVVGELKKTKDLYDGDAMHFKDLLVEIAIELYNRRENGQQPKILVD
jgi:hypothetical protein